MERDWNTKGFQEKGLKEKDAKRKGCGKWEEQFSRQRECQSPGRTCDSKMGCQRWEKHVIRKRPGEKGDEKKEINKKISVSRESDDRRKKWQEQSMPGERVDMKTHGDKMRQGAKISQFQEQEMTNRETKELSKEREVKIRRCHEKGMRKTWDKGKRCEDDGNVKKQRREDKEMSRARASKRKKCCATEMPTVSFFFGRRWSCTQPVDTFFRPINSSETFHRWLAWVLLAKY